MQKCKIHSFINFEIQFIFYIYLSKMEKKDDVVTQNHQKNAQKWVKNDR